MTREPKRSAASTPTDGAWVTLRGTAGEWRDVRDGGAFAPAACAERLAICAESGDVSEERARELAAEDARRCAERGACLCRR